MRDVFLSDATAKNRRTTYTARRAMIVRSDNGPRLVMFDGMAETLRLADRSLEVTRFSDFAYDLGGLIKPPDTRHENARALPTLTLLRAGADTQKRTGDSPAQLLYEGNGRINQALLSVVAALTGFAALLVGGYSRFGLWRQILGAIFILIILKSLDNAMAGMARNDGRALAAGLCLDRAGHGHGGGALWLAARPGLLAGLRRRRRRRGDGDGGGGSGEGRGAAA